MITRIVTIAQQHIDTAVIREAGEIIRAGGLVAFMRRRGDPPIIR